MGKTKTHLERHYNKWGYIFMIPFVVAFLLFRFWPMAQTFFYSFCYLKHAGNTDAQFLPSIGEPLFKNFIEIFQTSSFRISLKNTLEIWVCTAVPELVFTFWLAAVITDRRLQIKGKSVFKAGFFFPRLVQGTTVGSLLTDHLMATVGSTIGFVLVAAALDGFGITIDDMSFLVSGRFLIILLSIYVHYGITFIYVIAGITGVPVEVIEAAEIDGATRTQTFLRVTLPCMRPMLFFIAIVTIMDGVGAAEVPGLVTGQFDIFRTNLTLSQFIQNQFAATYAYDRGAAGSLIMLAIYVLFGGIVYFFLKRDKYDVREQKLIRKEKREAKKAEAARLKHPV